jgi:hypothetical protein
MKTPAVSPQDAYAALCDYYGADPTRWPEAARTEGARLTALDPAGVATVASEARALAALLSLDAVAAPSAALEARILNTLPRPVAPARRAPLWQRLAAPFGMAAAAAASFALSLVLMPVDFGSGLDPSDAAVEAVLAYTLEDPGAVDLSTADIWGSEPEVQL